MAHGRHARWDDQVTDVAMQRAGAAEFFTFPAWANGRLFFAGWDGSAVGLELWTSDGTPGGTALLKDINPSGDSYPTWPIPVGNAVYFDADDGGTFGRELWRSDGTPAGTLMVANLNRDGGSYPGSVSCDDGNACTTGERCEAGACVPGIAVTCGLCEQCDPAAGCVGTPRAGCRRPTRPKAALSVKAARAGRPGRLAWSWRRGTGIDVAELGNPTGRDSYALCLYDRTAEVPRLLLRADAPAGGACGKRPCWRPRGRAGFRYRNAGGAPDGLVAIDLRAGGPGRAAAGRRRTARSRCAGTRRPGSRGAAAEPLARRRAPALRTV